jgi:hypothetical protein
MTFRTNYTTAVERETVIKARDISPSTTIAVAGLTCLVSLWIRAGIPIHAITGATFDDQLFLRTATTLLNGHWLGAYDNLTLAKGMFYPLFIVLAFYSSVPLNIAEQVVYLLSCGLGFFFVRRATSKRWIALVVFCALALNPVLWTFDMGRVIREGLYISLSLGTFLLVLIASFPELRHRPYSVGRNIVVGGVLGAMMAAFWTTREEGIWLLPPILVVCSIRLAQLIAKRRGLQTADIEPRISGRLVLPISCIVVFSGCVITVAGLNYKYYGTFSLNEFKSANFLRANGALTRIQHDEWKRFVPVPVDARERAYGVSGTARELKQYLEGNIGKSWIEIGCSTRPDIQPCNDLLGGFHLWALRDAVAKAGYYRSAAEADAYYARLAEEINRGCATQSISCLGPRASLQPPFRREYVRETIASAAGIFRLILRFGKDSVYSGPSLGPPEEIAKFSDLIGVVSAANDGPIGEVHGWVAAPNVMPSLQAVAHSGANAATSILIMPADDVRAVFPELKSERFDLESTCPSTECDLVVAIGDRRVSVPFASLHHGAVVNNAGLRIYIDRSGADQQLETATGRRRTMQARVGNAIASVYATLAPTLFVPASIGLLIAIKRRRSISVPMASLCVGSLVAILSRISLLAYIDATSFRTQYLLYASPVHPFVILYIVSGLCLGLGAYHRNANDSRT